MQEDKVSLETAKLSREKGFDWEVRSTWIEFEMAGKIETRYYPEGNVPYMVDGCSYIKRPTLSILQKWLRDVHQLSCEVESYSDGTWLCWVVNDKFEDDIPLENEYCDTYEEALEFGLQEALKLISWST
jgi:hypothetical protein